MKLKIGILLAVLVFVVTSVLYINTIKRVENSSVPSGLNDYTILITQGETGDMIIDKLVTAGFLPDSGAMKLYVRLHPDLVKGVQAGYYVVEEGMSVRELFASLKSGAFESSLTFIEGWRREEYAAYLAKEKDKDFALEFYALTEGLEGKLFPDTYFIDANTTPELLVATMTQTFHDRYDSVDLSEKPSTLTKDELLVVASLIERETYDPTDRAIVAGIVLKRLAAGMGLGIDASTQYAVASKNADQSGVADAILSDDFTWWPQLLNDEDINIDSIFNTRKYAGLPPHPICNPGISAIEAVIFPVASTYWYYLTDSNGIMRYANTLEGHNANIAQFGVSQ
ncbi:endolytic transglycosylase MltG [candidate division WWE3 bacterium]|uniref:Endolytic murein transglycosylase n=1 Tax=candidate division WWE3 bacterium TaxID=2053526 RepID=A0A955RS63_UNCKA|nr:endolytic transglycosylase MltG [candidate division WWE3 bacterium]